MLSQLLRATADRTPEALALTYAGTSYSYRKLGTLAGRLGRGLAAQGVGKGDRALDSHID